jgi:glycerol-3-phosphate acyltransferase PlsY
LALAHAASVAGPEAATCRRRFWAAVDGALEEARARAALVAAVFTPVYYLLCDGLAWRSEPAVTLALGSIACLLIWRHSANVGRLIHGTEPRIGTKR